MATAIFTTLLHWVLATTLPIDFPPSPYVPVSYIPDKGILPTPYSEVDKIDLPRTPYVVTPSLHHIPPLNKPEVYEEEKEIQPNKPSNPVRIADVAKNRRKPELDMILPNVRLGLVSLSGMVSKYKKDQGRTAVRPEPLTVVIKPGRNRSKPDEKDKLVEYKEGQPMFKPENPGNFKDLPNSYRYTTPAKPERPRNMDATTASETDYGQLKAEEQSLRSYKTDLVDDGKPTNFDYSSYTSMSYDDTPENVYRTLGPFKSQAIHTFPYNYKPVAQKPTYNYRPTQPIGKGEKQVELPPVPKTMPLLRRIYIALLNTISGLPGGNTGVLDSIRAG